MILLRTELVFNIPVISIDINVAIIRLNVEVSGFSQNKIKVPEDIQGFVVVITLYLLVQL